MEKRIKLITILKVMATLFVVYVHGHNIYGYGQIDPPTYFSPLFAVAKTGVPLFFLISGYLQFKKPVSFFENLVKKAKRLGIPFLIWNSFYVVLEVIGLYIVPKLFNAFPGGGGILERIINVFGIPFYKPPFYVPLWYIRDYFILSIFSPWIQKALKRQPVVILVAAIIIWFSPTNTEFRQALSLFPVGGLIATNDQIKDIVTRKKKKITIIVCAIIGIAISLVETDYQYRISVLFLAFSIYEICKSLEDGTVVGSLSEKLIPYSFAIYVFHGKLLTVAQIIYLKIFPGLVGINTGYVILPSVVFIFALMCGIAFKKTMPKVYSVCMGEKAD